MPQIQYTWLLALCSSLTLACNKPSEPAAATTVDSKQEPAAAKPPEDAAKPPTDPPPAADSAPQFWVAHEGLQAYSLEGAKLASLGDRGDLARRLADGRVVVVEGQLAESTKTRLSVLDKTGKPSIEVALPTSFDTDKCSMSVVSADVEPGDGYLLSMQSSGDFALNAAGTHACVSLLDRNENMADYSVQLAIDLATGKVETAVTYDVEDHCPETSVAACKDLAHGGEPWTEPWTEEVAAAAASKWAHAYDEKTGVLSQAGKPVRELCIAKDQRGEDWDPASFGCLSVEHVSSSGRWMLVTGEFDMGGDYIYRHFYLLDLETGALSTRVCEPEGKCKLTPVAPESLFADEPSEDSLVVGESEIETLPGDRFWIDGQLLIAAEGKLVQIGGTLVLTVTP